MNFLVSWGGRGLSDSVGSCTNSGKMKKKKWIKKKRKSKNCFLPLMPGHCDLWWPQLCGIFRKVPARLACCGHGYAGYSGKFSYYQENSNTATAKEV